MTVAPTSTVLQVDAVSRMFGGFTAVKDVSFDVADGQILGIAGPNGAGKSTLFNLISGVPFGPSGGSVTFDGDQVQHLKPHAISRLGLRRTFQAEQLFNTLSVRHNVTVSAAFLAQERPSARAVRADAAAALDRVGISDYADARASDVPVLIKKKIMIASALVADPKLLMLDEPAGGLDEDDQLDLITLLKELNAQGLTLIVIEHVLSLLRELAERLIIMSSGSVLTSGRPATVLSDPAVVEAYLGVDA